jgi:RHS repeat-associated protein
VSERNYEIRVEQKLGTNRYAVFFAHDRETIDYHYERNPVDPRVTHAMTLEVDEFGNGLKSVAIAYPRRQPAYPEQGKTFITYTENQVTNKPNDKLGDPDWYRIGVPIETRTYEITGLEITSLPSFVPYSLDSIRNKLQEIASRLQEPNPIPKPEIAYEEFPDGSLQRRLIEQVRTLYRPDAQANNLDPTPLALGVVESLALPYESFKLAFTPGLLAQVYSSKITTAELNLLLRDEGKYVQQNFGEGVVGWWIPSGRQAFDPNQFYLAIASKDPFGQTYKTTYDTYALLGIKTEDPIGNEIKVKHDYQVMQPWEITDPNGNRSQAAFDALGMVVGTAIMGKATGSTEGDSLTTFNTDLTSAEITAFFDADDPRSPAIDHLGTATTRIIYDLDRVPVCAAAIARKKHVSDLAGQPLTIDDVQVSFVYSDGFGREAQTKAQAEPGPLDLDVPNSPILNPRWVGTGTKFYNNKGKPVRQYEPFFSSNHKFGIEQHGVSSTLFYDPVERVVATLHPNHTYEKVVFDPWKQDTWDVNDTVTQEDPKHDPDVGGFFQRLPDADYLPTWYTRYKTSSVAAERDAATKASAHANTQTTAHADVLGRAFLTIARNGLTANDKYATHVTLDIEGNQRVVTDARGNRVMVQDFDLLSHVIHSQSGDAGERWMLNNVAGKPIRRWDGRGFTQEFTYDKLQRPLGLFVSDGQGKKLAETTVYGEAQGDAKNHRGKVYQVFDGAGVVTNEAYDFKGNLLSNKRQLLQDYRGTVDWLQNPTRGDEFTSSTTYDALNRPTTMTTPDRSVYQPIYNEANLLEQVKVNLRGSTTETLFVKDIDYNAKGQRVLIEYSVKKSNGTLNVVATEYHYDPDTFRLTNLTTIRQTDKAVLQNLSYTYDPVGNITEIRDKAQQTIFFQNDVVSPSSQYEYDPLYRLIRAEGREHVGQNPNAQPDHTEIPRMELPHVNNAQAMRRYRESYEYDPVGNILKMIHRAMSNNQPNESPVWTRRYSYQPDNNRLQATSLPGDGSGIFSGKYAYDEHGNMTQMPHLPLMQWDFKDQLQASSQQIRNDGGKPEITYFVYDSSGQRVRKVTERQAEPGQPPKRMKERIYLGGFELYREYNADGNKVALERETLHIMDDQQRIALVETKTVEVKDGSGGRIASPQPIILYQLGNHLGSASLELDEGGNVISYEEYHSYGTTAYQGGRSVAEVSLKRYRYTGKERDEESGLYYHGARYYAPWLGRWSSCDPAGMVDGSDLYQYVASNPIRLRDISGMDLSAPPHNSAKEQSELRKQYQSLLYSSQGFDKAKKFLSSLPPEKQQLIAGGKASAQVESVVEEVTRPDKFQGVILLGKIQLNIATQVAQSLIPVPIARVIGSFQTGLNVGQAATGESLTGEKLGTGERVLAGIFGILGVIGLARGYAAQNKPDGAASIASSTNSNFQHTIRGSADQRGIGVLYVRNAATLTPDELKRTISGMRDMDFQAGMAGGLVRTVAKPFRKIADSVAALGRRLLGLQGSNLAAGHLPDVAGGGNPVGVIAGIPEAVNKSWGGQWGRYKPGFTFEGYSLVDRKTGQFLYKSLALEHEPTPILKW